VGEQVDNRGGMEEVEGPFMRKRYACSAS